ncbi:polysaccharide pyruvyl transferase family protein [Carboxylicivirga taeanensis]|uniref:polysaccharide pyruvyl transferase family protein n=1 Tax=Carboxylicivirga taeanensis TaxID=1416875 RepID=UPI003F6DB959
MNNIIIKGNFAEGNFGDDALLLAFHQLIDKSGVTSAAKYASSTLAYHKDLALNAEVTQTLAQPSDLIIYAGGTQFFSFNENKTSLYDYFKSRLSSFIWKLKQTNRFAMVGVGIGPFMNDSYENRFAKVLVQKSEFIWVRDQSSLHYCEQTKSSSTYLGADMCFMSDFQEWCNFQLNPAKSIKKIGIVLRDWKYGQGNNYIKSLIELPELLHKQGYEVSFYVFSEENDSMLEKILNKNGIAYKKWLPQQTCFKSYLAELNTCDLFITSRYHAAVFSTLMEKPFITIGLEQKLTNYSSSFENEAMNWLPNSSLSELLKNISLIDSDYAKFVNEICKKKKYFTSLSDKCAKTFSKYIKKYKYE